MTRGALLVLASLIIEVSGASLSARQQTATAPVSQPADDRTAASRQQDREAERGDDGSPGIKA
jgi:hypothetical protein